MRYERQLMLPEIGEAGQAKLEQSSVLVVGAGGLGCPVLQYLTAAGVGRIVIVDDDVVSLSNLQRQILYSTGDIGSPKVQVAQTRLTQLNPHVDIVPIQKRLSQENAQALIYDADIVVDACDNFATRYVINDACDARETTWVHAAVSGFSGQMSVFNAPLSSGRSGTYRCLFPIPPKKAPAPVGVIGVTPAVIGSMQAAQVIKILCDLDGVLMNQLLSYDLLTMTQTMLKYRRVA